MNKKMVAFFFGTILACVGCRSHYVVINETPPAADLKAYKTLSVGWLDLGEDKAKEYGYDGTEAASWSQLIKDFNLKSLPEYLKKFMPEKTIHTVSSKSEAPVSEGLIITFSEAFYRRSGDPPHQIEAGRAPKYQERESLFVVVHFIDGKSGKELSTSKVSPTPARLDGSLGFDVWTFEGCIDNCIYNLARYIADKVH